MHSSSATLQRHAFSTWLVLATHAPVLVLHLPLATCSRCSVLCRDTSGCLVTPSVSRSRAGMLPRISCSTWPCTCPWHSAPCQVCARPPARPPACEIAVGAARCCQCSHPLPLPLLPLLLAVAVPSTISPEFGRFRCCSMHPPGTITHTQVCFTLPLPLLPRRLQRRFSPSSCASLAAPACSSTTAWTASASSLVPAMRRCCRRPPKCWGRA